MDIKGKTILVTGADGFIGSHLVEMLVKHNAKVRALSFYNSFNRWGWLEDIGCLKQIDILTGDIRDPHYCKSITKGVDIIFNLAALIGIPYSYICPDSYVETNIKGALNICQSAIDNKVSRVIQVSTSEVYGTASYIPIDERHPLRPQSPYSASKIGADAMAMSFYYAFCLPLTIARPFNTYGPRQSARAVIAAIITQIACGYKQIRLGDVTPSRDFNYVLDVCRAMISICECDKAVGQTFNIGSNTEISIEGVFTLIKELMNADVELIKDSQRLRPEKSEVKRLVCDNSKIRQLTGFEPAYDLYKGLKLTIDWFRKADNLKKYKPDIYNI